MRMRVPAATHWNSAPWYRFSSPSLSQYPNWRVAPLGKVNL